MQRAEKNGLKDRRPGIQIGRGAFMICGHIDSAETVNAYTEKVRKAIAVLRETYVSEMHHGK
ncbi:MAG: hypothetical protein RIN62_14220 [Lacrimispora sp.]|jgi:hypothetical protein|nr:hypothetical protein [Lacrimispora sp.]